MDSKAFHLCLPTGTGQAGQEQILPTRDMILQSKAGRPLFLLSIGPLDGQCSQWIPEKLLSTTREPHHVLLWEPSLPCPKSPFLGKMRCSECRNILAAKIKSLTVSRKPQPEPHIKSYHNEVLMASVVRDLH